MWGDDWTGCKLWSACGGTRCKPGSRKPWKTPAKYPRERPPGVHPERSKHDGCPGTYVTPEDWRIVRLWSAWKQLGGMPGPGSIEEQEARLVDAFAILDGEQDMIAGHHREQATRRATSRRGRRG